MDEGEIINLRSRFESLVRDLGIGADISALESKDSPVLTLSFGDIDKYDPDLASTILDEPIGALRAISEALKARLREDKVKVKPTLRVINLPRDARVGIRDIRADHLGRFISVEGLVKKATEVRPIYKLAAYYCASCGETKRYEQTSLVPQTPLECSECHASAAKARLSLRWEDSVYANSQKLEIQEIPEGLKGGAQPEHLIVYCMDDLTGKVNPGDRVIINGILRPADTGEKLKSNIQDIQLDAVSIEMEQKDFDELEISKEDEELILKESKDPNLMSNIISSIAPTICGYGIEKESMALQMFGGVEKNLEDGTKIRGDIHILLVGDPGVAKSQMIRYMSGMVPRGVYVSGKATSAAGLIAAAVKDDFGEGKWTLEAGAMVLADKGEICVDELDKVDDKDRSSLHEAMEAQEVHVAKAGINATLPTRCSMLAACNPEYGRFNENSPLSEQLDLPPTLLSRFDLIFAMTDKPNAIKDEKIARHVMRSHRRGEALKSNNAEVLESTSNLKPHYPREFVRKYVAYSKKIVPLMSDEADRLIVDKYLEIRKRGEGEDKSVPITARQLEAFIRLSEASARSRLSTSVDKIDAERAIRIVDHFLQKMAGGDIDAIEANFTHSKRGKLDAIISTLKATPQPISKQEIEEKLDGKVKPDELESMLDQLHRSGRVSESRGKYAIV